MKRMEMRVKSALDNTIDLKKLSHNLYNKYLNFLQGQITLLVKDTEPY